MTARPIDLDALAPADAINTRVRVRPYHRQSGRSGTIVHIDETRGLRSYLVALDNEGARPQHRLFMSSALEVLDDTPRTSSASLAEDPADTPATPCATSATPDPVDPATVPAPEAGAASAHDAAPARDELVQHDVVLHLGPTGLRRVVVDGHDMICPAGSQAVVTYADGSLPTVTFTILAENVRTLVSASPGVPATTRGDRRQVGGTK